MINWKLAQLPADTRPAVGYPGFGGGGAGQLGHEDAVDVSGKDQDTEKLERTECRALVLQQRHIPADQPHRQGVGLTTVMEVYGVGRWAEKGRAASRELPIQHFRA